MNHCNISKKRCQSIWMRMKRTPFSIDEWNSLSQLDGVNCSFKSDFFMSKISGMFSFSNSIYSNNPFFAALSRIRKLQQFNLRLVFILFHSFSVYWIFFVFLFCKESPNSIKYFHSKTSCVYQNLKIYVWNFFDLRFSYFSFLEKLKNLAGNSINSLVSS